MPTLLVIDDEPLILQSFHLAFPEPEITVLTAATAAEGLEKVVQHSPDVVVLDIRLPDLSGLEAFRRIRQLDAKIPTILMTGRGSTATAIEAMTLGAYEYLLKPLQADALRELIFQAFAVSRSMRTPVVLADPALEDEAAEGLVGRCPAMQAVYKSIGRAAPQDVTVLIAGESGTGKELVARAIYNYSRRSSQPFLAINCAAIPETLLESELFGHEKGAFTGAERKRIGKFEQCSGGTLFLDEIGDMPPLTQAKILRVLQEQQFERVGGNETIRTDVRLIAATNRHLEEMVAAGQFRGDLYYRLNVFTIRLPPLRERGEDLPLLVDHFLKRFNRELGKEVRTVAPETLELLRRYPWPGNLRELQSVLRQALLQATGPVLVPESLPASFLAKGNGKLHSSMTIPSPGTDRQHFIAERLRAGAQDLYAGWLGFAERELFTQVLRHTSGNVSQAAKILGLHRSTLRTKIHSLGITIERSVSSENDSPR